MEQKHLETAEHIVKGIAYCKKALTFHEATQGLTLSMKRHKPGSHYPEVENFHPSNEIRDKVIKMFHRGMELKIAAYRRRAAQIGLVLED